MMNVVRVACVLGLAVPLLGTSVSAATIWYTDNNLGRSTRTPVDFVDKFRKPETFAQATKHMNVYMMRGNILQKMDDYFFTQLFFPYLEKNQIKLAIDATGATWLSANPRRQVVFDRDMALFERIKRLGGRVDYISLQSILSKPLRDGGKGGPMREFPLADRIRDAVVYAQAAQRIFPAVEIGIIDALPSKGMDHRDAYRQLAEALKAGGSALSYVHLDISFEAAKQGRYGTDWSRIREIEKYLEEDLKVQFGLFTVSRRAGQQSSAAFRDAAIASLQCYAGSGGTPREYVFASWFKYPELTIPETATGDDYPAMRIFLELGDEVKRIEQAGAAWVAQQKSDPAWMSRCGISR